MLYNQWVKYEEDILISSGHPPQSEAYRKQPVTILNKFVTGLHRIYSSYSYNYVCVTYSCHEPLLRVAKDRQFELIFLDIHGRNICYSLDYNHS